MKIVPETESTQIGGRQSQTRERGFRSWRRRGRSGPIMEEIMEEKGSDLGGHHGGGGFDLGGEGEIGRRKSENEREWKSRRGDESEESEKL
ncbi:hypothetical protein CsSME_00018275 [Camellia sinensis var. sinensis]